MSARVLATPGSSSSQAGMPFSFANSAATAFISRWISIHFKVALEASTTSFASMTISGLRDWPILAARFDIAAAILSVAPAALSARSAAAPSWSAACFISSFRIVWACRLGPIRWNCLFSSDPVVSNALR
jgi:hypothetical protein